MGQPVRNDDPTRVKWWVVLDKDYPGYGAQVVIAKDEEQALQRGLDRWNEECGEDGEGTLFAQELPIPVTPEQLENEGW